MIYCLVGCFGFPIFQKKVLFIDLWSYDYGKKKAQNNGHTNKWNFGNFEIQKIIPQHLQHKKLQDQKKREMELETTSKQQATTYQNQE